MRKTACRMALAATCMLAPLAAGAQAVIFPQQQQAGTASSAAVEGGCTLSNDLLSATFLLDESNHLSFGGCPQLGLKPGTDLFTIEYQNGTVLNSGSIQWESVEKGVDTSIDPNAVRASLKMPGKMIEAKATLDNGLKLVWRAVLRNGSHYLRTEMELTNPEGGAAVPMHALTPMIFTADKNVAGEVAVVGNTRGAILASPKIFAGLETPMGLNSVADRSNSVNNLKLDGWTAAADWTAWKPATLPTDAAFPTSISDNGTFTVTADKVDGMHGYLYFPEAGNQTVTFLYSGGNIRIDLLGVEIAKVGEPAKKAADYHHGFTGGQKENNVYTLNVPEAGVYEVTIYRSAHGNFAANNPPRGTITWTGEPLLASVATSADVTEPTVSLTTSAPETPELSTTWATADFATPAAYADVPGNVTAMIAAVNVNGQSSILMQNTTADFTTASEGSIKATYAYTGKSHARWYAGAELYKVEGDNAVRKAVSNTTAKVGSNGSIDFDFGTQPAGTYRVIAYSMHQPANAANNLSNSRYTIKFNDAAIDGATADQNDGNGWERPANPGAIAPAIGANFANFTENGAEQLYTKTRVLSRDIAVSGSEAQDVTFTVRYGSGNVRLCPVAVMLVDADGNIAASDCHYGYTGTNSSDNTYTLNGVAPGNYTLRLYSEVRSENNTLPAAGTFAFSDNVTGQPAGSETVTAAVVTIPEVNEIDITGRWSRHTDLMPGKTWEVGAVVGLIAQNEGTGADQTRRSILSYIERERAVPWHSMVIYNSWYELNINRNNSVDPDADNNNMYATDCERVVNEWRKHLYDENGTNIGAFVWDDGWDRYGTWTFNNHFPNGFKEPNDAAVAMGTGIGAWLGPVGGYGQSGTYRRNYWNGKGGMQLSNPAYYKVFLDAVTNLTTNYDFRYFKFDGISGQFSATGPDAGYTGEENAEAIIDIESQVRKIKPDIFLNTTVGTWASPFWYRYTDATWRQENDFGTHGGQGSTREQWITYRDRLVYQNYVQNSPLCPINNLMTHGVMVTKFGPPAAMDNTDYDGIVREIRAAFACGSAQVELYTDYELLNNLSRGTEGEEGYKTIWTEIADAIKWQRNNADVLPDIHWVGGNPGNAEVYGWASWNGRKATVALRNPKASEQTFTINLRRDLELPAYCSSTFTFKKGFADQADLAGMDLAASYGADQNITVTLPANSIYVFDGVDSNYANVAPAVPSEIVIDNLVEFTENATVAPAVGGKVKINKAVTPEPIEEYEWRFEVAAPAEGETPKAEVSEDGTVTFLAAGTAEITVAVVDKADNTKVLATVTIPVTIAGTEEPENPTVEPGTPDDSDETVTFTPGASEDDETTPDVDETIASLAIVLTEGETKTVEIPATVKNTDTPASHFEFHYDGVKADSHEVATAVFAKNDNGEHVINVTHGTTEGRVLITLHPTAQAGQPEGRSGEEVADDALWKLYVTVKDPLLHSATGVSLTGVPSKLYLNQSFTVGAEKAPAASKDAVKIDITANPEDAVRIVDNGDGTFTVTAVKTGTLTVTATLLTHAEDAVTTATHTVQLVNATGNPGQGVTGIDAVNTDAAEGRAEIYDLAGRRIRRITAAGMYIVNGVKTIVR